ncbi:MAG: NAD(P)-dependent oxidoreductase, partial [Geminicoccaceae bacterium]
MSVEIAAVGAQRPFVLEALEREFVVHKVFDAPDLAAALGPAAGRVRGAVSNAMAGLPSTTIEALPNLEICAIMGVGLERTDLALAKERGIVVTTTPLLYDDVSDLAVILAMNACRRIVEADRFVRSGQWLQGRMGPAHKFSGKRAGILGLGRIGVALAARLQGFAMKIGYYDPLPKAGVPYRAYGSAAALARDSDILFLCAAGGQTAGHIVTAEVLDALGPKGIFVNVALGDEYLALVDAFA